MKFTDLALQHVHNSVKKKQKNKQNINFDEPRTVFAQKKMHFVDLFQLFSPLRGPMSNLRHFAWSTHP